MKKLIWDVETTDLELAIRTYQLKNNIKYFNPKDIRRDWSMLGVAWMWEGEEKAKAISVSSKDPLNDKYIIEYMHSILSQADVLIGHNSDNFDIKKFNTRSIYHGLPPLAPKLQIDTLKIARKYFKFTSNRLGYICEHLGIHMKDESPDWIACINGDKEALKHMREYNRNDIYATRDLYHKLMSWHHTHPSISGNVKDIEGNGVDVCKKCASPNIIKRGFAALASGRKRQRFQCSDCNGWQSGAMI